MKKIHDLLRGQRGAGNQGAVWIAAILGLVLLATIILWMRDRESADADLDIRLEGDLSSLMTDGPGAEALSDLAIVDPARIPTAS